MTLVMRPRRPHSPRLDPYRLGFRLVHGLTPAQAARAERAPLAEVEALLAQPEFQELLQTCRELDAMPAEERLALLERMALTVLEHALASGDLRAALFFLRERQQGRNPARMLALKALSAPRPAPTSSGSGAGSGGHGLRDGSVDAASRGGAVARDQLAAERVACAAAVAAEPAPVPAHRPCVILPAMPVRRTQHLGLRPAVAFRLGPMTGLGFHLGAAPAGPTVADLNRPRWPAGP
jgi:hypothetical protein